MPSSKPRILCVDDDELTRNSLQVFITRISEECFFAKDGEEAFEIYKQNEIDIVLSDINMPKLNGIELSRKIREINPEQSIILVTAHNQTSYLMDAIDLGLDGYISKPIFVDKLYKKITDVYEKILLKRKVEFQEKIIIQQEKMVSMGEMIGNIAHQWRQPLNALGSLITNLHIKHDSNNLDEEFYRKFFTKSDFLIQKMSETIDDFSNFFKPDKSVQEFLVEDVVKESINLFENTSSVNIDFNIKKSESFKLNNFKNEILQVFVNIIKNSHDAYVEKNIKDKTIDIDIKEDNNRVIISFVDKAGGIEKENLERIFEPYFTTKHKADGTGIGLYMCKMIIENSVEGFIDISNYKDGVKTTINLPNK